MIRRKNLAIFSAGLALLLVLGSLGFFTTALSEDPEEPSTEAAAGLLQPVAPTEPASTQTQGGQTGEQVCATIEVPTGTLEEIQREITVDLPVPVEPPAEVDDVCTLVDRVIELLTCDCDCTPLLEFLWEILERVLEYADQKVERILEEAGLPLSETPLPQRPSLEDTLEPVDQAQVDDLAPTLEAVPGPDVIETVDPVVPEHVDEVRASVDENDLSLLMSALAPNAPAADPAQAHPQDLAVEQITSRVDPAELDEVTAAGSS